MATVLRWNSFVVGFGMALAMMIVIAGGCVAVSGTRTAETYETVTSPEGRHASTRYVVMGGGAPGWCSQRVDIHPGNRAFDVESAVDGFTAVFTAGCSVNVEMTWVGDDHLRITYPLHPDGLSVYQLPEWDEGRVRLSYRTLTEADHGQAAEADGTEHGTGP